MNSPKIQSDGKVTGVSRGGDKLRGDDLRQELAETSALQRVMVYMIETCVDGLCSCQHVQGHGVKHKGKGRDKHRRCRRREMIVKRQRTKDGGRKRYL